MGKRRLGGRVGRGARLARTGLRGATGLAGNRVRGLAGRERDERAVHEAMASHLAEVLGDMKGAAMKVGQLLSFVDLDVPDHLRSIYHDALAQLRDAAPAFDPEAIAEVIRQEY